MFNKYYKEIMKDGTIRAIRKSNSNTYTIIDTEKPAIIGNVSHIVTKDFETINKQEFKEITNKTIAKLKLL